MAANTVDVDVFRDDAGRWRWTSKQNSSAPPQDSPTTYVSAAAAIAAAQANLGPGGVLIIVR
ncbi:hypothetical protein [Rhodococcus sp. NPDC006774]|uniref:hypothetical protein n=1 Tax=Rhodococcus sp. NPDC006774 TaxID=3157186 RepID=UPI0033E9A109